MFGRIREHIPTPIHTTERRLTWPSVPPAGRSERRRDGVGDLLRTAIEQAPHGLLILGDSGEVLVASRAAEAVFAHGHGQLVGHRIEQLIPATATEHASWWKTGAAARLTGIRMDGATIPLEVAAKVVVQGPTRYGIVSVADISERLDLEARVTQITAAPSDIQRLIAEIAERFISIETESLDGTITDSLSRIGSTLGLDRIVLWQKAPREHKAIASHCWLNGSEEKAGEAFYPASAASLASKLEAGEATWFNRIDEVRDAGDREAFRQHGLQSCLAIPIALARDDRGARGVLSFTSTTRAHEWTPAVVEQLRLVCAVFGQALCRRTNQVALDGALDLLEQLRERALSTDVRRRRDARPWRTPKLIVPESEPVRAIVAQMEQVAPTPATVLLLGETGTGKEIFAEAIHNLSPRHARQMIRVNCAAIPSTLIESELFGREKGAYTDAVTRQVGRFELANHSTIFLDEIGELTPEVQVKLLRVIQERALERLGSPQPIKIDVRIIAATNRNLEQAVADGSFREDLFYRLNVFPIVVPPLRDRVEDIPELVWAFVDEFSLAFNKRVDSIARESMDDLQRYAWPGNVRELRNVIERSMIIATGPRLTVQVPTPLNRKAPVAQTLADVEIEHIRTTLESTKWRIRGRGGAAERLGLKPTTLESRIARLGLVRPRDVMSAGGPRPGTAA